LTRLGSCRDAAKISRHLPKHFTTRLARRNCATHFSSPARAASHPLKSRLLRSKFRTQRAPLNLEILRDGQSVDRTNAPQAILTAPVQPKGHLAGQPRCRESARDTFAQISSGLFVQNHEQRVTVVVKKSKRRAMAFDICAS